MWFLSKTFAVVQWLSCVWLFAILETSAKFAQTHVHWVGDAIQSSHCLLLPSPPALSLSQHQSLFQRDLCIGWPKYWSLIFSISPSNEYSRLISFRADCPRTLKSIFQHHNLKAPILWSSALFTVQLSHQIKKKKLSNIIAFSVKYHCFSYHKFSVCIGWKPDVMVEV